jgi:TPR repeat protein
MVTKIIVFFLVLAGISGGGTIYWNVRYDEGVSALKGLDYGTAAERLEPLALLGDSTAQFLVGQLYAFGLGVTKDDERAIMWFRKSAWEHHGELDSAAPAEYYVAQDYAETGGMVEQNYDEASKWLRRAAEGGHKLAAALLAKAYSEGLLGLPQDLDQARAWLERAP